VSIKIIIADDHMIMRKQLVSLIEVEAGMEIIAEAEDGKTVVQLTKDLLPDVVIMDINMPRLNGIEATRQILADSPDVRVIVVSMRSERQMVMAMLRAGSFGYVLKDRSGQELITAIRTVVAGKKYLSPGLGDDYSAPPN
jgi:DNA-binding NarL/FixJ family response regulator